MDLFRISEVDRCEKCHREEWEILGPDGHSVGITFWDEEGALDHLDTLNRGVSAERARIREALLEDLLHQHQGKMPLWVFDDLAASIKRICSES